jgi:integrase
METVYLIDHNLELCKRRLQKDISVPEEVKKTIMDFTADLAILGLSKHRQYFYIERLKLIARLLGQKFLAPEKNDIRDALLKLQDSRGKTTEKYSERTLEDIKISLKKFYKTYQNGKYFDSVSWLKKNNHPSKEKKTESIITIEELNSLLTACYNERDRSIISLLYDSGCRIGELLTLRVKDVDFDQYGVKLTVHGKTGNRRVRVVGDSVSLLREYMDRFARKDPGFPLYVKIGKNEPLQYQDVDTMLDKVSKRAGITRHIHPHLFRHTRATLLARDLKEAPLEATMGWVHGSRMSRTYVHLSDEDIDNAVLKVYGIVKKNEKQTIDYRPKICPRCHTENPTINEYCLKCGLPLDANKLIQMEEKEREVENALLQSPVLDQSSKDLLRTFDPQFKDKILEALIQQILENPESRKKFRQELKRGQ